jgi:hypothetical protein
MLHAALIPNEASTHQRPAGTRHYRVILMAQHVGVGQQRPLTVLIMTSDYEAFDRCSALVSV